MYALSVVNCTQTWDVLLVRRFQENEKYVRDELQNRALVGIRWVSQELIFLNAKIGDGC